MEFTGKIIQVLKPVGGTSNKTGKEWKKIQFVVEEENKQFPNKVFFEVFGEDKFKQMPIVTGKFVTVSFDVESHDFNGRWYTSCKAYRVIEQQPSQQSVLQQTPPTQPAQPTPPPVQSGLPF